MRRWLLTLLSLLLASGMPDTTVGQLFSMLDDRFHSGPQLFIDHFDDGVQAWSTYGDAAGSAVEQNGRLELRSGSAFTSVREFGVVSPVPAIDVDTEKGFRVRYVHSETSRGRSAHYLIQNGTGPRNQPGQQTVDFAIFGSPGRPVEVSVWSGGARWLASTGQIGAPSQLATATDMLFYLYPAGFALVNDKTDTLVTGLWPNGFDLSRLFPDGAHLGLLTRSEVFFQEERLHINRAVVNTALPYAPALTNFWRGLFTRDDQLAGIENYGINVSMPYADILTTQARLDAGGSGGFGVLPTLGAFNGRTDLLNWIDTIAGNPAIAQHPALAGWYLFDEPETQHDLRGLSRHTLKLAYDRVKSYSEKPVALAVGFFAQRSPRGADVNTSPIPDTGDPGAHPPEAEWDDNPAWRYKDSYDVLIHGSYPFNVNRGEFDGLAGWIHQFGGAVAAGQILGRQVVFNGQAYAAQADGQWANKRLPTAAEAVFQMRYAAAALVDGMFHWALHRAPTTIAQPDQPYPFDGLTWYSNVYGRVDGPPGHLRPELDVWERVLPNGAVHGVAYSTSAPSFILRLFYDTAANEWWLLAANPTPDNLGSVRLRLDKTALGVGFDLVAEGHLYDAQAPYNISQNTSELAFNATLGPWQTRLWRVRGSAAGQQFIDFEQITDQTITNQINLSATASSGLPVTFSVLAGPAKLQADTNLHFTGLGTVHIQADQAGGGPWMPAQPVIQHFEVTKVPAEIQLSDLFHTHDGHPKPVSASTTPPGLLVDTRYTLAGAVISVNLTYDGTAPAPSEEPLVFPAIAKAGVVRAGYWNHVVASNRDTTLASSHLDLQASDGTESGAALSYHFDGTHVAKRQINDKSDPDEILMETSYQRYQANMAAPVNTGAGIYHVHGIPNAFTVHGYDLVVYISSADWTDRPYTGQYTVVTSSGTNTIWAHSGNRYVGAFIDGGAAPTRDSISIENGHYIVFPGLTNEAFTLRGVAETPGDVAGINGFQIVSAYRDRSDPPIGPGTYWVVTEVDDPIYAGGATGVLTIAGAEAKAQIILNNLDRVYDGTPQQANITTDPPGLDVVVTYEMVDGIIGINLTYTNSTEQPLLGEMDAAGVVPAVQWNQIVANGRDEASVGANAMALTLNSGLPSGALLTHSAVGGSVVARRTTNATTYAPDDALMAGVFTRYNWATSGAHTYMVTGLPDMITHYGYDVVVYVCSADFWQDAPHIGQYRFVANGITNTIFANTGTRFTGTFMDAGTASTAGAAGTGNYIGFTNQTAALFTLEGVHEPSSPRSGINGFQIVSRYTNREDAPVPPGNYRVVATVDDAFFTGSVTGYMTVAETTLRGVPAAWYQAVGLHPVPGMTWNDLDEIDSDGDGMKNWEEFVAGTDPSDHTSFFVVEQSRMHNPDEIMIEWTAITNRIYSVWSSTHLVTDAFQKISPDLQWPANSYTSPVPASNSAAFFILRVRQD